MQANKDGERKLFRLFGHFSLLVLLGSTLVDASSFENFKKSQNIAFAQYKDTRDSEFRKYLTAGWKEFVTQQPTSLYEKAKPKNTSSLPEKPIISIGPKLNIITPTLQNETILAQNKSKLHKKDVNFDFYGSKLGFNIDSQIKEAKYFPQTQEGIASFFDTVATSEYEYLVKSIEKTAQDMNLNDWGIYLLVDKLGSTLFPNLDNKNLFSWFIFNKLGYAVKVGIVDRHITTMFASDKIIYAKPSYIFNSKKYYVLTDDLTNYKDSLYSYDYEYPNATKSLNLALNELPNFNYDLKSKSVLFTQYGQEYSVKYAYNQNLIDFMSTYPQADYEIFFNTPLDEKTYDDLSRELKKYINGMQASKAINFVLKFVQNAFQYETDSEQFGVEKVMFAQETLYFNKSDCEDRAILFSSLIKRIFKIAVVGVKYKDHMSTALYIPMDGDSVNAEGRRFVIADPTYINANVGTSMPQYKYVTPESFIIVNN